jgi:hypothetical protein
VRIATGLIAAWLCLALAEPAHPEDAAIDWAKSAKTFHVTERLPRGTQVRIRVVRATGKHTLDVVEWVGRKKDKFRELKSWPGRDLRRGQVVRYTLRADQEIGIRVTAKNAIKLGALRKEFGYHRMQFGDKWALDVKLVDPEF